MSCSFGVSIFANAISESVYRGALITNIKPGDVFYIKNEGVLSGLRVVFIGVESGHAMFEFEVSKKRITWPERYLKSNMISRFLSKVKVPTEKINEEWFLS